MQKSHVIIGAYNHLPEGTEESYFEETYQVCWRPFLSTLYRFPELFAVLHYSGTVLRWLEARHPEFLMLLEEMTGRKQLELLGGGFFAPLLPLVPGQDKLGQIELLTTYIRKAFGRRPRGSWLQDYAWEPGLASTLQTCGFDFTFLPERQFRLAGASLSAPALTEDQGKSLLVFPVFDASESFAEPLPPLEALGSIRGRCGDLPLVTIFYPDRSSRSLWARSGLESPDVQFESAFAALQKDETCETTTPSRYLKSAQGAGRAYFAGSGSELLLARSIADSPNGATPALPAYDGPLPFVGTPRRLLLRYEESAALYAKMHYVRILVGQLRGDKSRKKSAQEELWRGQCGEAYWYGPSGGLRRLPVRAAAYAALIEAEKTTRQRGSFVPGIIRADIDFDGLKEILYQGADYNAYLHLRGAVLAELDSLRTLTNYVNALADEGGHLPLRCFHDRFCAAGSFPLASRRRRGSPSAEGAGSEGCPGFDEALFTLVESDRPAQVIVLGREGSVELGGKPRQIAIRKSFSFRKGSLGLDFEIVNRETEQISLRYVSELNLALASTPEDIGLFAARGHDAEALAPGQPGLASSLTGLRLENRERGEKIEIRSDSAFALSYLPLYLQTEVDGRESSLYQGSRFLLGWELELEAGAAARFSLTLELGKL